MNEPNTYRISRRMTHGGSGALTVYNADQKAVIGAFGALEKDALYLFFADNVKGKTGDIAGYMPLQRQAGFIYDNPSAVLIAHELGHGAFNLRHTFSEDRFIAAQGATENLMDYNNGTELWMHQWNRVQDPENLWLAFAQEEKEGEYDKSTHLAVAPDGRFIDRFYMDGKNIIPTLLISNDFSISKIKYNEIEYQWNSNRKAYINGTSEIVTEKDNEKPAKVNLFKMIEDHCLYEYTVVDWSAQDEQSADIHQTIASKITTSTVWIKDPINPKDAKVAAACAVSFVSNILSKDKYCLYNEAEFDLLTENISTDDPEKAQSVVNSVCLSTLRSLAYDDLMKYFKLIASQKEIKEYSELALLRLMNALNTTDYAKFYSALEENENVLIKHLIDQMNDVSPYFWKDKDNFTNFMGALIFMFAKAPESYNDRLPEIGDERMLKYVISLDEQTFQQDLKPDIGIIPLSKFRYRGYYNEETGKSRIVKEQAALLPSEAGYSISWLAVETTATDIRPLDPVMIISTDNLPMVQTALDKGNPDGRIYVVPAVFFKFKADKEFNKALEQSGMIALDALTIYASGGTAITSKVHWVKRVWAITETAGAIGNMGLNTGVIESDSDFGKAVGIYNGAMALIGMKNAGKGMANLVKELPDAAKGLLQQNASIRTYIAAEYLKWQTICKNLDGLSIDDIDKLIEQEKVWKTLGLLPEQTYIFNPYMADHVRAAVLASGESMEKFINTNVKAAYKFADASEIKWMQGFVRTNFGKLKDGEIIRKIISMDDFNRYQLGVTNPYLRSAGFITRADDYMVPGSSEELIEMLRLDFPGTKFSKDKGFVCIEFKNKLPDAEHAFDAPHDLYNGPLYTNTGCTGSATSIIPEYYSPSKVDFSNDDVLKVFDKDGKIIGFYEYSEKSSRWVKK